MSDNYLGNPNLKKTNVQQEFTAEQVEEYVKCSKDPSYFIEKYIKIVNLDEGFIPFNMYPFQKKMQRRFIEIDFLYVKYLDSQVSLLQFVLTFWHALFNPTVNCAILANNGVFSKRFVTENTHVI